MILPTGLACGLAALGAPVAGGHLQPEPAPLVLHVATSGNDGWSGAAASPDEGDGPLASLASAFERLRALRGAGTVSGPVTIIVHEGTYFLDAPMVLGPEDSGLGPEAPVVVEGAPGEAMPVISGGVPVTGWRREGPLWAAPLPGAFGPAAAPGGLWIDGQRRTPARSPNDGFFYIADALPGAKQSFRFFPGDIRPEWDYDPATGAGAVLSVLYDWEVSLHHIASVRPPTGTVSLTAPLTKAWASFKPSMRYFVQNVREALDAPGEWFCDAGAREVLYMPAEGEPPPEGRAVASRLPTLLSIVGTQARTVDHIAFRRLAFEHADWTLPPEGVSDGTGAITLPAAVEARWARGLSFADCVMTRLGGYGVWLQEGTSGCTIRGCEITDLGGGGIKLGQPEPRAEGVDRDTGGHTVDNCFIHGGGITRPSAIGVWVGRGRGNTISRNDISGFAYSGIFVGWTWGYGPARTTDTTISGNHVHHIGRGLLSDLGAVYLVGEQPGTEVSYNFIHDVDAEALGHGLYADAGCSYVDFHHNIVANTIGGCVMVHYGRSLSFRNNIFAFAHADQFVFPGDPRKVSQISLSRNIFYYTNGRLLGPDWGDWSGAVSNQVAADDNLYYEASGRPVLFGPLRLPGWRAAGRDEGGRIADPLFERPEEYDFSLRPGSPARDVGFEPIEMSRIGLYGDPDWVSRPGQLRYAPFPLPDPRARGIGDGFEAARVGLRAQGASTIGESPTEGVSIRIADDQAAHGSHSLKFRVAPRWRSAQRAAVAWRTLVPSGPIETGFSIRLGTGAAPIRSPVFMFDWCDNVTGPVEGRGPALRILADGTLLAGGRSLARLPFGSWVSISVNAATGTEGPAVYSVAVGVPGRPVRVWTIASGGIVRLEQVAFASPPDSGVEFWIDDVRAGPAAP